MYKTKSDLKDELLEVLDEADEPMTATELSRAVGYSQLRSRVADALAELITDGEIETSTQNGNIVYSLCGELEDENEDEDEEIGDGEPIEISEVTLPERNNGYDVEMLAKGHVKVTFPPDSDGERKDLVLEPNERLLVINQDEQFRFVVSEPEHVLEAIHVFTQEKGITTYLVTDMATGQTVPDVTDINMKVAVIFLTISRHNKAGQ